MLRAFKTTYPTIWLCVDDGSFAGSFTVIGQNQSRDISSLADFLLSVKEMLDAEETDSDCGNAARPEDLHAGGLATFLIRILRREHQSWQGTVRWVEGEQQQAFRSALELVSLIDSAISGRHGGRLRTMDTIRERVRWVGTAPNGST